MNSIERFCMKNPTQSYWELIVVYPASLASAATYFAGIARLNDSEILILGGIDQQDKTVSNVRVFNSQTCQVTDYFDCSPPFKPFVCSSTAQCVTTSESSGAILVPTASQEDESITLIKFTPNKRQSEWKTVIEKLGEHEKEIKSSKSQRYVAELRQLKEMGFCTDD